MESVLIALVLSPALPFLHILLLQLIRKENFGVRIMFLSFFLYYILWFFFCYFYNGYVSPTSRQFISGISTIIFFCLGYMEAYSMICRGFSLRIITDIYLNNSLTANEIITEYSDGRGIDWMIRKRINSIKKLKLISFKDEYMRFQSSLGVCIGFIGIIFKKILKMGPGG